MAAPSPASSERSSKSWWGQSVTRVRLPDPVFLGTSQALRLHLSDKASTGSDISCVSIVTHPLGVLAVAKDKEGVAHAYIVRAPSMVLDLAAVPE